MLDGTKQQLELLITVKNTHPILGLHWMIELGLTFESDKNNININHINKPKHEIDINITTPKRFAENQTDKNVEVDIQPKDGVKLIQQKSRPIPIHLQPAVEKEIEKLKRQRHIERANNIDENCFVSPAVITIKKDKSVKIVLDSRKPYTITKKSTDAKHGGTDVKKIQQNSSWTGR